MVELLRMVAGGVGCHTRQTPHLIVPLAAVAPVAPHVSHAVVLHREDVSAGVTLAQHALLHQLQIMVHGARVHTWQGTGKA